MSLSTLYPAVSRNTLVADPIPELPGLKGVFREEANVQTAKIVKGSIPVDTADSVQGYVPENNLTKYQLGSSELPHCTGPDFKSQSIQLKANTSMNALFQINAANAAGDSYSAQRAAMLADMPTKKGDGVSLPSVAQLAATARYNANIGSISNAMPTIPQNNPNTNPGWMIQAPTDTVPRFDPANSLSFSLSDGSDGRPFNYTISSWDLQYVINTRMEWFNRQTDNRLSPAARSFLEQVIMLSSFGNADAKVTLNYLSSELSSDRYNSEEKTNIVESVVLGRISTSGRVRAGITRSIAYARSKKDEAARFIADMSRKLREMKIPRKERLRQLRVAASNWTSSWYNWTGSLLNGTTAFLLVSLAAAFGWFSRKEKEEDKQDDEDDEEPGMPEDDGGDDDDDDGGGDDDGGDDGYGDIAGLYPEVGQSPFSSTPMPAPSAPGGMPEPSAPPEEMPEPSAPPEESVNNSFSFPNPFTPIRSAFNAVSDAVYEARMQAEAERQRRINERLADQQRFRQEAESLGVNFDRDPTPVRRARSKTPLARARSQTPLSRARSRTPVAAYNQGSFSGVPFSLDRVRPSERIAAEEQVDQELKQERMESYELENQSRSRSRSRSSVKDRWQQYVTPEPSLPVINNNGIPQEAWDALDEMEDEEKRPRARGRSRSARSQSRAPRDISSSIRSSNIIDARPKRNRKAPLRMTFNEPGNPVQDGGRVRRKRKLMMMHGSGVSFKLDKKERIISGRDDVAFGIYAIDKKKLKDGIFSVIRLSTRKKVNEYPNSVITPALKTAIYELLQGDTPIMDTLSSSEQTFIRKFVQRSKVTHIQLPSTNPNNILTARGHPCVCMTGPVEDKLAHELEVNLGHIQSGNNSSILKACTVKILHELIKRKKITLQKASEINRVFELEA